VVRHRARGQTSAYCGWCALGVRLTVFVSMQDGGKDKVGKDSGHRLME
jgi:hypothetical protein